LRELYALTGQGFRKKHPDNDLDFDDWALTCEATALLRAKEAACDWQVASNAEVTINNDLPADLLLTADVFTRGRGE
jgi:hypothetical protein